MLPACPWWRWLALMTVAEGRSFGSFPSFVRIEEGRGWKFGAFCDVLLPSEDRLWPPSYTWFMPERTEIGWMKFDGFPSMALSLAA